VLWDSKVVLLDEPTAALGVAQTRQVLDLVRRLAEQGLGVVLISHNMADVFEVADRISTLYLGRLVADLPAKETTHSQVVELITAGRSGEPPRPARASHSLISHPRTPSHDGNTGQGRTRAQRRRGLRLRHRHHVPVQR